MRLSRRRLLASGAGLPALASLQPTPPLPTSAPRHSSFDPWVEVRADHLRANATEVARVTGRPILAVIKNDGYGAGVVEAARALEPIDAVAGFAVVKLHEAMTLRDAGVRKPILLMGPFDAGDLVDLASRGIAPMVYTPIGADLDRAAARVGRPVSIHVCVDTGIGRVGVPYTRAAPLLRDLAARRSVRLEGTMMTFTEDPAFDREQLARFERLCRDLEAEGLRLGRRHAASTYALFQHPDAALDMVRPGMALYGVYPEPAFRAAGRLTLRPALALRARVVYVKRLAAGESAGYERAYVAPRDVWVATLPVGHADGVPRAAARGVRVRIGGALFPIVASVSASHTIVEIGDEPRAAIGDVATLFDWEEGSRPEDVAAACGASVYDLLMHLNPLLPRRRS
ncbi:MAG TPA: alanine racemase [Vicinamibacterales bacterium]|nr:alanine racemase [Vicinamibacterales bacterium]